MPRCKKLRMVDFIPDNRCFIPTNVVGRIIEEVVISIEEIEAIRLSDLENLDQDNCAEKMNISRSTFQRVLNSARSKIADAILNGKVIKIEGGNFTRNICYLKCNDCGNEWTDSYENYMNEFNKCPKCESGNIKCVSVGEFCRRNCRRYRGSF